MKLAESQDYLFELKTSNKKIKYKIVSAGFDPISKLNEIPQIIQNKDI